MTPLPSPYVGALNPEPQSVALCEAQVFMELIEITSSRGGSPDPICPVSLGEEEIRTRTHRETSMRGHREGRHPQAKEGGPREPPAHVWILGFWTPESGDCTFVLLKPRVHGTLWWQH